jgi:hypothetical protein
MTFIEMGIEPDGSFRAAAEKKAAEHHLDFRLIRGDLRLIEQLVKSEWDHRDFLLVQPGEQVIVDYTEGIIAAGRADE